MPVGLKLPGVVCGNVHVHGRQAYAAADIDCESLEVLELLVKEEVDPAGHDLERTACGAEAPAPALLDAVPLGLQHHLAEDIAGIQHLMRLARIGERQRRVNRRH